jgi:hypothetical protein
MTVVHNVVAIVGCQRSGTTLTGQILGAHPDAVLLDEADGIYRWFRAAVRKMPTAADHYKTMLERAVSKYRVPESRFTRGPDGVGIRANVSTLVLKAPNLTYDFEAMGRLSQSVSVLYPVRDPRAVVASMMRLPENDFVGNQLHKICKKARIAAAFGKEYRILASEREPIWARCAALWSIKTGLAPHFQSAGLRVLQFRYEDLVRRHELAGDLLRHCALSSHGTIVDHQAAYVGKGPGGTDRTRAIDEDSLESWKESLDEIKEAAVLRIAGPLAQAFGYT